MQLNPLFRPLLDNLVDPSYDSGLGLLHALAPFALGAPAGKR